MNFKIIAAFMIAEMLVLAAASVRIWPASSLKVYRKSLARLRQNPALWGYTFVALVLAIALIVAGGVLLCHAPPNFNEFSDVGPAVGDLGVISAALFALGAAFVTIIASRQDARDAGANRKAAIEQICRLEILAFWDRANELALFEGLERKIRQLKNPQPEPVGENKQLFRRYLGEDWFRFSLIDPLAIGELEIEMSGSFLALSARARNLISRFNWLNGASFPKHSANFWIAYMEENLRQLETLDRLSRTMLIQFGDRQTEPRTFRFKWMGQIVAPGGAVDGAGVG